MLLINLIKARSVPLDLPSPPTEREGGDGYKWRDFNARDTFFIKIEGKVAVKFAKEVIFDRV